MRDWAPTIRPAREQSISYCFSVKSGCQVWSWGEQRRRGNSLKVPPPTPLSLFLRETEVEGRRGRRRRQGRSENTPRGAELLLDLWQETSPSLRLSSVAAQFTSWNAADGTPLSPPAWHGAPSRVPDAAPLTNYSSARNCVCLFVFFPRGTTEGIKWLLFAPNKRRRRGWRQRCTWCWSCWPGLVGVWVTRSPAFRRARERPADTGRSPRFHFCIHLFTLRVTLPVTCDIWAID